MHLEDYQWERLLWKLLSQLGDTVLMLQMLSDADSMVTASAVRKWTNTDPLLSMQAMRVISHTFATHGLPDILVSDNGTAFTSAEFQFFAKANGFRHVRSAPYHPATNGLAERAVQTLKNVLKRMTGDVETCLARFLFQYRLTPHSTMGQSPAELFLGRKSKSHLDSVFPSLKNQVQQQQERQKDDHDQKASHHTFMVGERVYCLNHNGRKEMITSQEQDVEDIGPLDPNMPPVPEKQPPTPPMSDFTTPASA
ncbi:hypothetical protein EMCRGX_G028208 [Ephydatia muelleri]